MNKVILVHSQIRHAQSSVTIQKLNLLLVLISIDLSFLSVDIIDRIINKREKQKTPNGLDPMQAQVAA